MNPWSPSQPTTAAETENGRSDNDPRLHNRSQCKLELFKGEDIIGQRNGFLQTNFSIFKIKPKLAYCDPIIHGHQCFKTFQALLCCHRTNVRSYQHQLLDLSTLL